MSLCLEKTGIIFEGVCRSGVPAPESRAGVLGGFRGIRLLILILVVYFTHFSRPLNIQEPHVSGIALNESAPRLHVLTH